MPRLPPSESKLDVAFSPSWSWASLIRHLVLLTLPLVVCIALGRLVTPFSQRLYLPLHTFAEVFSIVVAAMICAVGFQSSLRSNTWPVSLLAFGFLAVALLDFGHMLSFDGMPVWVTPSGPSKAIHFWLAARLAAATTLMAVALASPNAAPKPAERLALATFTVVSVGVAFAVVLFWPNALPAVFAEGSGLLRPKILTEALLVALMLMAAVLISRKTTANESRSARPSVDRPEFYARDTLVSSVLAMAVGELAFTTYSSVTDLSNLAGHVYKVYAYWLLYRAVFVTTVRVPFTQLAIANEAIRASEQRFTEMADAILDVFWLRDAKLGALQYASPSFDQVFGRPRADLIGKPGGVLESVDEADRERVTAALASEESARIAYRIRRPDGEVRWLEMWIYPVRDAQGVMLRQAGVTRDITDARKIEEQLSRTQKMEAVGRLAGGVAHDFNNLLTVILSVAQLGQESMATDDPVRAELAQIEEAAQRAAALTRQLLAFARRDRVTPKSIDLVKVTQGLFGMLRRLVGEDVTINLRVSDTACRVLGDAGQIEQVLMNLVVNARDATERDGSIEIGVDKFTPDEAYKRSHPDLPRIPLVRLWVADQGVGMPEHVLAHAFEPFFTTKPVGHGTGLGLATCFGIVKQADGHIFIESAVGRGTKVWVLLPELATEQDAPSGRVLAASRRGDETVLVVEDEPAVRHIAARGLRERGYRVIEAADGVEALDVLERGAAPIALVLTDIVMPRMGGYELGDRIRRRWPHIALMFTTGYDQQRGDASGAPRASEVVLEKPYTVESLAKAVRESIDRRKRAIVSPTA
jgi:two-component system, cell cycle sensor histidine kinase and response regulator CckA